MVRRLIEFLGATLVISMILPFPVGAQVGGSGPEVVGAPKVVKETGQQIKWIYPDGRVAGVFVNRFPSTSLSVSVGVGESTCDIPQTKFACEMKTPYRAIGYSLRWLEHSSPEKIGKTVSLKSANQTFPIEGTVNLTLHEYHHARSNMTGAEPAKLACNDFTWLAGTKAAPERAALDSWSTEAMFRNPDTGGMENRTHLSIFEPSWVRESDAEMRLDSTGVWVAIEPFFLEVGYLFGNVYHFITEAKDGRPHCQIALKPELSTIESQIRKYISTSPGEYVPYLMGSDDFLERPELKSTFESFAQVPEGSIE